MNRADVERADVDRTDVSALSALLSSGLFSSVRFSSVFFSSILLASVLSGCGGGAGDRPAASTGRMDTIDSAGVTLAINYGGDRASDRQPVKRFTLQSVDGSFAEFSGLFPGMIATGADGHVWVIDREAFTVREFGPDGVELRSLGRKGQGPGEFQFPLGILKRTDGPVWVMDVGKRAFVTFGTDGTPEPEVTFREEGNMQRAASFGARLVLQVTKRTGNPVSPLEVLEIAGAGDTNVLLATTLSRTPAHFEDCGVAVAMPPLFSKRLEWATNGKDVVATRENGYIIDRFIGDSLVTRISRDIPVQLTNREMADRDLGEGMTLGVGDRTCKIPPDEVVEKLGMNGDLPVVDNVALAPDGTLWVKRRTFPDEPSLVDLLAPDGHYQGTLTGTELPVAFFSDGSWLAIETDSLDVQHVVARSF